MICTQCGAQMNQTDKNTMSGRDIREYECPHCGHSDFEDKGVALSQMLHDAREQDEAEARAIATQPGVRSPGQERRRLWQRLIGLFGVKS
jgi:predicted  nucleic acid-binding Zn-ribbon protein